MFTRRLNLLLDHLPRYPRHRVPTLLNLNIFRRPVPRFSSSSSTTSSQTTRIDRVISRLPTFLQPYTTGLRNAPTTHIVSFLLLHEITAVVPLIGLSTLFHYTNWLPQGWTEARYITEGVNRYGRYFKRKGWFGFGDDSLEQAIAETSRNGDAGVGHAGENGMVTETGEELVQEAEREWGVGGGRILVEVATAYALTKVFLPARILVSVWATPWFARIFVGRFMRIFGKGDKGAKGVKETLNRKVAGGADSIGNGAIRRGAK